MLSFNQGAHKVRPAYKVPDHIIKPQYVTDPQNPQFGVYSGHPVVHSKAVVESITKFTQN